MNNHAAKTMCTTFVDLNYLIVQNELNKHFLDELSPHEFKLALISIEVESSSDLNIPIIRELDNGAKP